MFLGEHTCTSIQKKNIFGKEQVSGFSRCLSGKFESLCVMFS